jgi:hypothetical protein
MGSWVQFHYINGSLSLMNSNYSDISNNLLGSAEPNGYTLAPPLTGGQHGCWSRQIWRCLPLVTVVSVSGARWSSRQRAGGQWCEVAIMAARRWLGVRGGRQGITLAVPPSVERHHPDFIFGFSNLSFETRIERAHLALECEERRSRCASPITL